MLLLLIALLCGHAHGASQNWPMWRYDAARSATSPHQVPDQLHLQWTRQYPATAPAWPAQKQLHFDTEYRPVVMDGTLFLGSPQSDWVAAVDVKTGREKWRAYTGGPVRFAPVAAEGRLYVASDDGHLYCLNPADGKVVWRKAMSPNVGRQILGNKRLISTWPVRGGPAYAHGRLYTAAGIWPFMGVFIRAVDPKTGETLWCNSGSGAKLRGQPHGGQAFTGPAPQGYLAVTGDRVLVPNGRAVAACFDATTGAMRYFRYGATRSDGHSFIAAARQYYFSRKTMFDVETGRRHRTVGGTPVISGDMLYSGNTAYDLSKAAPFKIEVKGKIRAGLRMPKLWQTSDVRVGRMWIRSGDKLYASVAKGLVALKLPADNQAPKACWKTEIEGEIGSVLTGSGRLFVVTRDGAIRCYGKDKVEPKTLATLPPPMPKRDKWTALAAQIVKTTGVKDGHAVVLGVGDGRVVEELARQTSLHVIGVPRPGVDAGPVRRDLDRMGLYGARTAIVESSDLLATFPPYLARLVVVKERLPTDRDWQQALRLLRPYGGTLALRTSPKDHEQLLGQLGKLMPGQLELRRAGEFTLVVRVGPLPGAGTWTHQNGDVSNSVCSRDNIVKAPLGVLWFGGSTNTDILPRHGHGPCPQVTGGRIIIEGPDKLRAMDVYTGRILWEADLPGIGEVYNKTHHAGGANNVGGNYVSLPDAIYAVVNNRCVRLDPATGKKVAEFALPKRAGVEAEPTWGYIGVHKDVLLAGAETQTSYDPDFVPRQFPVVARDEEYAAKLRVRLTELVAWLKEIKGVELPARDAKMSDAHWAAMCCNTLIRQKDLAKILPGKPGRGSSELLAQIKTHLSDNPGVSTDDLQLRHLNRALLRTYNGRVPYKRNEGKGSRRSWAHASSKRLVAMNRHTGKVLWTIDARKGFLHNAICAGGESRHGDGVVFCIDAWPPRLRNALVFTNRLKIKPRLIALDAAKGTVLWETDKSVFGTWLAYSAKHKLLLQSYRPSRDSVDGSWGDRMNVRDAATGAMKWERREDYGGPCMLVGDRIITQGRDAKGEAWDIHTGRLAKRIHPVLGVPAKWRFQRSYGCGTAVASTNLLTFRSGAAGFYDLLNDGGTGNLGGFRSGCTSNMIVADGVLTVPDYTRTCSCAYHNQTSIALIHDPQVEMWTYNRMYINERVVKRVGLNLGAPGDRKAANGTLWTEWPSIALTSPDVPVLAEPGTLGHFRHHSSLFNGDLAWVGASGRTGLRKLTITLGEGPERTYTLRLIFAEPDDLKPGARVFDIAIQGKTVLKNFDPVRAAGKPRRTVVREIKGVKVTKDLVLKLTPKKGAPLLCGIEIIRESAK
jgi:outer membrane protein assembly factor BamB